VVADPHGQEKPHHHNREKKQIGAFLKAALQKCRNVELNLALGKRRRDGIPSRIMPKQQVFSVRM
jgi:hypothetical protein